MLNLLTREPLIGSVRTSLGQRKKKSRTGRSVYPPHPFSRMRFIAGLPAPLIPRARARTAPLSRHYWLDLDFLLIFIQPSVGVCEEIPKLRSSSSGWACIAPVNNLGHPNLS